MSLKYAVVPGTVVLCDYSTGFREPEMVKRRLALVVSPRLPRRDRLCTVVPLSETAPHYPVLYQCQVRLPQDVPNFEGLAKWAKADMLATVGFDRLDLPRTERDRIEGRRRYLHIRISAGDLARVRNCILHALGMGSLTESLEKSIS